MTTALRNQDENDRGASEALPVEIWQLRLYVAGKSPRSIAALGNLKRICEEHLHGQFDIEVIDVLEPSQLADDKQILAILTLMCKLPEPIRRVIGDLSDSERVLIGLDLRPRKVNRQ